MPQPDYADVITAEDYTQGLAEHPDIPQADAGIARIIRDKLIGSTSAEFRVLDLGCGPGRITKYIADELLAVGKNVDVTVVGLDISQNFITFAESKRGGQAVSYICADFLAHNFTEKFDVVLMQGLYHHVPRANRKQWLEKCRDILGNTGVVIIGDEFVPDYATDEERVLKVAGLYAYVIAYALQNGHQSLAEIESMNMVDDVCAGLPGAGHSDKELIKFIQDTSSTVYASAHEQGVLSSTYKGLLKVLVERIQLIATQLSMTDTRDHNRGDYKISIKKQVEELTKAGLTLERQHMYGPVHWLGGMGVLVFKKTT